MRAAHVPSVSFFVRGPHDASGFHPFPSMNDVIAANRSGYGAGNAMKRRLTELVATRCREVMAETGWVAPMGPVEVSLTWHEVWRGRDVDNVMSAQKFVLDGMVEAGMLRGDSQRYVPRPPAHVIVIDREHPGVTVEVSRRRRRMSRCMWVLDMDKMPPLITSEEAAQLARCSKSHITKLCRSGKIEAVRLGRHWRINTAEFMAYLGIDEGQV